MHLTGKLRLGDPVIGRTEGKRMVWTILALSGNGIGHTAYLSMTRNDLIA